MLRTDVGGRHVVPRDLRIADDAAIGRDGLEHGLAEWTRAAHRGGEGDRPFAERRSHRVEQRIVADHPEPIAEGDAPERRAGDPGGKGTGSAGATRAGPRARPERGSGAGGVRRDERPRAARTWNCHVVGPRTRTGREAHGVGATPQDLEQPGEIRRDRAGIVAHASVPSQAQSRPVAAASRSFQGPKIARSCVRVSAAIPVEVAAL